MGTDSYEKAKKMAAGDGGRNYLSVQVITVDTMWFDNEKRVFDAVLWAELQQSNRLGR